MSPQIERVYGPPRGKGRLLLGLVLLTLGSLWTLDNLGMLDADDILRWWPLTLVAFGAWRMIGGGGSNRFLSGFLLLTAGMLLTLREVHVIRFRFWDLWPVFLMLVGAGVVVRSLRGRSPATGVNDGESLNVFAIMGGVVKRMTSQAFRGGEVTAVMAGADIDLRNAGLAQGEAVVDVFTWWGGIDIMVPENWEVVSDVTPIMGAFEDKTRGSGNAPAAKLIVRGLIVMGGVEVKN